MVANGTSLRAFAPAKVAAPIVKYAGGKTQLLPEMRKHRPGSFRRYYEPCVGGGAHFFDLHPAYAVLADTNTRLMAMYRGVRNAPEAVIERLRCLPHTAACYAATRAEDVDAAIAAGDDVAAAVWFLYLNRTCFNGLYRVNRAGHFNVPRGRYDNPRICDPEGLRAASRALGNAELRVGDFVDTTADAQPGDFCYVDPPYIPLSPTSAFTGYTPTAFKTGTATVPVDVPRGDRAAAKRVAAEERMYRPAEHVRLRDHVRVLFERGVHVVVSNSSAPFVRELYDGPPFVIHTVEANRAVNSKASHRGKIAEVIITAEGKA